DEIGAVRGASKHPHIPPHRAPSSDGGCHTRYRPGFLCTLFWLSHGRRAPAFHSDMIRRFRFSGSTSILAFDSPFSISFRLWSKTLNPKMTRLMHSRLYDCFPGRGDIIRHSLSYSQARVFRDNTLFATVEMLERT